MYKGVNVILEGYNCDLSQENEILYEKYSNGDKKSYKKKCEHLIYLLKCELFAEQLQSCYQKNKKQEISTKEFDQEKKLHYVEQERDKLKEDLAATTLFLKTAQVEIKQLKIEVEPLKKRCRDLEQQLTEVRPLRMKLADLNRSLSGAVETIKYANEIVAESDAIVDKIGSIRN